ncbi:MAG TPA: ribosome biogenesis factor YjgA [Steroidobacteraceae bacterium]|nr:ribosome biogenesis factor YjgA [Steroidobacteraceae bacterium]
MAARDEDPEPDEPPSKSQRKRDAEDLKDLGDELVALPAPDLEALPLPEKLRDAIDLARRITAHGAAARQRQLIGKILRKVDVEEIRGALAARALARRLEAREFHRVEVWRDRLLAEGEAALAALIAAAPQLDAGRLRALVARAGGEAAAGRPPAAARELFRYLRDALAADGPSA